MRHFEQASSFALRAGAAAVCLALAGCGDAPTETTPPPPTGPEVKIERVKVVYMACADPCGARLTYQARRVDTGEPVAATLRLRGDGWYPGTVATTLPDGQVTFDWEYPKRSGATYRLSICPEVGSCDWNTATIYVPE